ncbi:MAG: HTH-type transcriptional activator RhaR [bacterium]|nr:HTH-type transcriptional activator RhaR [bacterium]
MNADLNLLFASPSARVFDFKCREQAHSISPVECAPQFEINFIRHGRFGYRLEKKTYALDSQTIMLVNAGAEQVFVHDHDVPDECTNIEIAAELLETANAVFWKKESAVRQKLPRTLFPQSTLPATPLCDFLHAQLFSTLQRRHSAGSALKTETLIVQLVTEIYRGLYDRRRDACLARFDEKLKRRHLETVERAKHFMQANFQRELTLSEIARRAFVSEFHFSRIFRKFTARSPYQYLLELRLHHALLLLRHTSLSVTEICFASGFNSFTHFIATFTKRYKMSPSKARA